MLELSRALDQLEAERLRALRAFEVSGAWADDGALSTQAWLRHRCRMSPNEAGDRVRVARRLAESLPATRAAFADGDIAYAHVRVIARTVDASAACADRIGEAEPILVDTARDADPLSLRRVAEHWKHLVDRAAFEDEARARVEGNRLHVSETFGGTVVGDFELDPEGGATVKTVIDAYAEPRPGGDGRSPSRRRGDALVELCRQILDRGAPTTGGERPHLSVMVPLDTLEARARAFGAEVERVNQPISSEAARRLACDCDISRIITGPGSVPLDIGRRTRIIPMPLRRAVIARDRHCVAPGCDRPPAWCEVHHRIHWIDGGETKLSNLELRCIPHHHAVHPYNPHPDGRHPGRAPP